MAALTVNTVSRSGFNQTDGLTAAASGGDTFTNTGAETLVVKNGSGGSLTVTLAYTSGTTFDGSTPSNKTVVIADGKTYEIGPFPLNLYGGTVSIAYSSVSSVTVAVRKTGDS